MRGIKVGVLQRHPIIRTHAACAGVADALRCLLWADRDAAVEVNVHASKVIESG